MGQIISALFQSSFLHAAPSSVLLLILQETTDEIAQLKRLARIMSHVDCFFKYCTCVKFCNQNNTYLIFSRCNEILNLCTSYRYRKIIGILSRKRYNFNAVEVRGMCYNIFCRIMTSLDVQDILYPRSKELYTNLPRIKKMRCMIARLDVVYKNQYIADEFSHKIIFSSFD